MANVATVPFRTHEGAVAQRVSPSEELRRVALTCLLFEDTFYESGLGLADRIKSLVPQCDPDKVADLAIQARDEMHLRHVPLFLCRELCRVKGAGKQVERALYHVIQRADELSEFLAIYWREGKQPIAAAVKRALAAAFNKFDAYQLAKYNRDSQVKLRDVMFLVHPKPIWERKGSEPISGRRQEEAWKQLADKELSPPDTWEVALSAGKDKKETFTRLLQEKRLGGLACLRNLRNMQDADVDPQLIEDRMVQGIRGALPFQFISAARMVPDYEGMVEKAMFRAVEQVNVFPGRTGLLIDVSGSMMDGRLSNKGTATRADAAAALAIFLRERSEDVQVAVFGTYCAVIPSRRGFALRDAIVSADVGHSTQIYQSLEYLKTRWAAHKLDRVIVVTDEQAHDGLGVCAYPKGYIINVAPYKPGLGYGNGWTHINGWSERVLDYIREAEREEVYDENRTGDS